MARRRFHTHAWTHRLLRRPRPALVGLSAAALVIGSASTALATPATAPTVKQVEYETLQPVLQATSTDAGSSGHTLHFFARTIGSTSWNLLNDVAVAGTDAYQALP